MGGLHADLIAVDGRIHTLGRDRRIVEALAARDGQIVAVGGVADVRALAGPDTVELDLAGRTAIPGLIDSHCHPDGRAARLARWEDLGPDRAPDRVSVLARLRERARALGPRDWVLGYRLNENKSGGYPSLDELDAAAGGRPLFVLRTDGHIGLANRAGFARLEIDRHRPDPPFGAFDHDPVTGELTGVVRETAAQLFLDAIQAGDRVEDLANGLVTVFDEFLAHGITTVYNSLTGSRAIRAYQQMRDRGTLQLRVGIIVSGREPGLVESFVNSGIASGFGDDWLRVIGVEWCPDCSTSGRTAAYYEPYVGDAVPGEPIPNTGMLLYDAADLAARATAAHRAGLLVCIEGVGDRGIDFALDAIEAALAAEPREDHRMRVEHCCHVTPDLLDRLARVGAVDSSATGFMYELGDAYRANRGAAAMAHMWPHRALIDAGIPAPGHSDAYVCTPNPFTAMWSMVNRKTDTGASLDVSQAIAAVEALHAYTTLGAYSGREEHRKGSLEVGKLADFAVLDRDLLAIPGEEIREVGVDVTVVGGRVAHAA